MNSKYINAEKILRIQVFPSRQTTWFRWKEAVPEKKFWWFVTQKAQPAGWEYYSDFSRHTEEYVLRKSSVADRVFKNHEVLYENSIWDKAYVAVESQGGKYTNTDYVYFEKTIDAEKFAQEISEKFPHIKLQA